MRPDSKLILPVLLAFTLLTRVALLSSPYYVDGPNHIAAIQNGTLFIQAPGYFLFNVTAKLITMLTRISAAAAVSAMNTAFSVAGVWVFSKIVQKLFPGWLGVGLAFCYALSNVVWFTAEIHSTYASMTFFGPLLLYVMVVLDSFPLGCLVWAVLAGFRPSDGVFLTPFLVYVAIGKPLRQVAAGVAGAAGVVLLWYTPTVLHFGGRILAPLSAAGRQVGPVATGILAQGLTERALGNVVHFGFGMLNSWNILVPFVFLGLFRAGRWGRLAAAWMLPAFLFFCLYFISDTTYMAFTVAPGMILAGYGLSGWRVGYQILATAASVAVCLAHMLIVRPIPTRSAVVTVINCYSFEYTGWALRHQYAKRLFDAMNELDRNGS